MQPAAAGLAAAYVVTGTRSLSDDQPAIAARHLQRAANLWTYWDRQASRHNVSDKDRHLARLHGLDINRFTAYALEGRIEEAHTELQRAFNTAHRAGQTSPSPDSHTIEPYLTPEIVAKLQDLLRQLPTAGDKTPHPEPSGHEKALFAMGQTLYEANFYHAALAIGKSIQNRWTYPDGSAIPTGCSPERCISVLMLTSKAETNLDRIAEARKTLGTALALIKHRLDDNPDDELMLQKRQECEQRWRLLLMRY